MASSTSSSSSDDTTNTVSEAIDDIKSHLAYSPATIFNKATDLIDEALNGEIDVVNATNPMIELLEVNAIVAAGLMNRMDMQTRKRFPRLAQDVDELYPHMTNEDFEDVFASPARNHTISIGLQVSQLQDNAVYNSTDSAYEIIMPQDTVINAGGYDFMFNQPIVITSYDNGDILAYFDDSYDSPVVTRSGTAITSRTETYEGSTFFIMDIPCDQMSIQTQQATVSSSSVWRQVISFTDNFYYARGYYSSDGGDSWEEMNTVYNGDYYDPSNPTMMVTPDTDNSLVTCVIPDVYIKNGDVGSIARVDIYTTQGEVTIDLSSVESSSFGASYNDYSNYSEGYVTPLSNITNVIFYSTDETTDGSDALTFEELRNKVIYGSDQAYTLDELKEALTELGYRGYLQEDDLTNRVYVAARRVDTDNSVSTAGLHSGINCANEPIAFTPDDNNSTYAMTVHDDNSRTTILPTMLYMESDGAINIVEDSDYTTLTALASEEFVSALNDNEYFWTPFHVILDYTNAAFTSRAYWMTNPSYNYINVMATNASVGFSSTISDITVEYSDSAYTITITCARPTDSSGFLGQLFFTDDDGTRWYWEASESNTTDDTMDFVYTIGTEFDISSDHQFDADGTDTSGNSGVMMDIAPMMSFVLLVETDSTISSTFDAYIYTDSDTTYSGVSYEKIQFVFGYYLEYLNLTPRTILTERVYETYAEDVYQTYDTIQYAISDDGSYEYTIDDDNNLTLTVTAEAGDYVTDDDGNYIVLHAAGDKKTDDDGNYTISENSVYSREVRLPLFDARFRYATTDEMVDYVESIPSQIYQYIVGDITDIQADLFENTKLYYEPLVTHKSATVKLSNSKTVTMDTSLSFSVVIQLTDSAFNDSDFKTKLTDSATSAIVSELQEDTVTITNIVEAIRDLAPTRILNIEIEDEPLGSTGVAIIEDNSGSFTLKKELVLESNGLISVDEDISFSYTH